MRAGNFLGWLLVLAAASGCGGAAPRAAVPSPEFQYSYNEFDGEGVLEGEIVAAKVQSITEHYFDSVSDRVIENTVNMRTGVRIGLSASTKLPKVIALHIEALNEFAAYHISNNSAVCGNAPWGSVSLAVAVDGRQRNVGRFEGMSYTRGARWGFTEGLLTVSVAEAAALAQARVVRGRLCGSFVFQLDRQHLDTLGAFTARWLQISRAGGKDG